MMETTKPSIRWHRLVLAMLLAAIAVAALHVWQPWQKILQQTPPPEEPAGTWVQVAPQLLEQRLGLAGRIQAASQQTLVAPFDGMVREVLVQEGERVSSGQPLIQIDSEQLDIQLRQARAELLKAQKSAKRLRNWSRSPEVSRARRAASAEQTGQHRGQPARHPRAVSARRGRPHRSRFAGTASPHAAAGFAGGGRRTA
ncbi:MAG: biotin/lipoyl-binding protein, partial [Rhodocyclaceae bacterium]|nr:biotin/lipoyl-binding protein [Rhodocyclaceae bacterium]